MAGTAVGLILEELCCLLFLMLLQWDLCVWSCFIVAYLFSVEVFAMLKWDLDVVELSVYFT